MLRWRRSWPDPGERLPVDVLPCSNGEFVPPAPTGHQRAVMALAEQETERWRRRLGMTRRQFVRTAAATTIGFWAIDMLGDTRFGSYGFAHNTDSTDACDIQWGGRTGAESLRNLPGEFIFDVQTHHVEPDGMWRVTNPAFAALLPTVFPQASLAGGGPRIREDGSIRGGGAGEIDPVANLSRFHYLKELFLDSATTMTVLSAVPTAHDTNQPLPIAAAAETVELVNRLAGSQRAVMHAFVMPNRGSFGNNTEGMGLQPANLQEELDLMTARAERYRGLLRGWKVYCPWGDVPYASGWFMHSKDIGEPFLAHVEHVSRTYGIPPVVATHKGFALPGFDQRAATTVDVGPAARAFPRVRFLVYHSGHEIAAGPQGPYPGDAAVRPEERSVNGFIRNLRAAGMDGPSHRGNSPNVYAELGSVWRDYVADPSSAAHLLGKLIHHVGPKRVVWGTDSLWFGSPHAEIVALRRLEFSNEAKVMYNLPHGLDGDVRNPRERARSPEWSIRNGILGRNAARAYGINPNAVRHAISCDAVNGAREEYVTNPGTEREAAAFASNALTGPRTRRELLSLLAGKPWGP